MSDATPPVDGRRPAAQVPDDVRAAALAAIVALDRDARVAVLTQDEDVDGARRLVFCDEDTFVHVVVDRRGPGSVRVVVRPTLEGDVHLELPGGPSVRLEQEGGSHVLHRVPQGPVTLVVRVAGQRCRTAWSVL